MTWFFGRDVKTLVIQPMCDMHNGRWRSRGHISLVSLSQKLKQKLVLLSMCPQLLKANLKYTTKSCTPSLQLVVCNCCLAPGHSRVVHDTEYGSVFTFQNSGELLVTLQSFY